jgi:hypothetical protein
MVARVFAMGLLTLFVLALAMPGAAETLGEVNTAMNMSDTLSGGYTPSGYFGPINRQQTLPGGAGAPNMLANPFGAPTAGTAPTMAAPVAAPPPRRILVLTGERVTCHVMGTLLEDIHYEYVPEDEKNSYYDDGVNGGDLLADDNIWTNYTERNDVLSPDANHLKLIYMRMLERVADMNPIEFFGIPVASEEPLSPLPRISNQERDRDETFLRRWHAQFLALYRQDSEDPLSDFYPIFVPGPPPPPDSPAPPDNEFNLNAFALDEYILATVDQAVAPAYQTATYDEYGSDEYQEGGRGSRGSRNEYTGGDRYTQARREASRYSTNQSSSYMRR